MHFDLPKLDYAKNALAPIMSEETLDLHHGKHHQTYITNLNNFVKDTDMSKMTLEEIIINSSNDKSKVGIFNNASQHWNHILFWKCMKPNGGGTMPSKLKDRIENDFGNLKEFKKQFRELVFASTSVVIRDHPSCISDRHLVAVVISHHQ